MLDNIADEFTEVDAEVLVGTAAFGSATKKSKKDMLGVRNLVNRDVRTKADKTKTSDEISSVSNADDNMNESVLAVKQRIANLKQPSKFGSRNISSSSTSSSSSSTGNSYEENFSFPGEYDRINLDDPMFSGFGPLTGLTSPLGSEIGIVEDVNEAGISNFQKQINKLNQSAQSQSLQEPSALSEGMVTDVDAAVSLSSSSSLVTTAPYESTSVKGMTMLPMANRIGMSKFQQQMSGEWNQKVLRREKYEPQISSSLGGINKNHNDNTDIDMSRYDFPNEEWNSLAPLPVIADIPSELSAFDDPGMFSTPPSISRSVSLMSDASSSSLDLSLLQDFDRDYMQLRGRLVALLERQQQEGLKVTTASDFVKTNDDILSKDEVSITNANNLSKFQLQMSGEWNKKILESYEKESNKDGSAEMAQATTESNNNDVRYPTLKSNGGKYWPPRSNSRPSSSTEVMYD